MSLLTEGTFPCIVTSGSFGADDRGIGQVQINVRFVEGPNAGRMTTYQDEVNAKSALYIGRSCKAVGWAGKKLETLSSDITAWIEKTGGKTTAEIRYVEIKRGKKFDEWVSKGAKHEDRPIWDKCNSIGRGAKPLGAPTAETLADANDAMARAMAEDAPAGGGGAVAEDDLPFASSALDHEPSAIARVLRGAL